MEYNTRPQDSTETLDDGVFEPPFEVQLAKVHELSEIWFALPAGRCVCAACAGVRCTDDWIGVQEQDVNVRKRVRYSLGQRGLLGAEVPMHIGAQLATQVLVPRDEEVGELVVGQRLSGLEELVTEPALCKPMHNSRPTVGETGLVVVATGEQADEDESASGQLDRRVGEDFSQSVDGGVVAIHATICVLHVMLAVSREGGACTRSRRMRGGFA